MSAQHKIHRFKRRWQLRHAQRSQDIALDIAHDGIGGQVVFVAAEGVFQFVGNRIQAEEGVADDRGEDRWPSQLRRRQQHCDVLVT